MPELPDLQQLAECSLLREASTAPGVGQLTVHQSVQAVWACPDGIPRRMGGQQAHRYATRPRQAGWPDLPYPDGIPHDQAVQQGLIQAIRDLNAFAHCICSHHLDDCLHCGAQIQGLCFQGHAVVIDLAEVEDVPQNGQQCVPTVKNGLRQLPAGVSRGGKSTFHQHGPVSLGFTCWLSILEMKWLGDTETLHRGCRKSYGPASCKDSQRVGYVTMEETAVQGSAKVTPIVGMALKLHRTEQAKLLERCLIMHGTCTSSSPQAVHHR